MSASLTNSFDAPIAASASSTRIVAITTTVEVNHPPQRRYVTGAKAKGETPLPPPSPPLPPRGTGTVVARPLVGRSTPQERESSFQNMIIKMVEIIMIMIIIRYQLQAARTTLDPPVLLGFLPHAPMVTVATSFSRMSCVETYRTFVMHGSF